MTTPGEIPAPQTDLAALVAEVNQQMQVIAEQHQTSSEIIEAEQSKLSAARGDALARRNLLKNTLFEKYIADPNLPKASRTAWALTIANISTRLADPSDLATSFIALPTYEELVEEAAATELRFNAVEAALTRGTPILSFTNGRHAMDADIYLADGLGIEPRFNFSATACQTLAHQKSIIGELLYEDHNSYLVNDITIDNLLVGAIDGSEAESKASQQLLRGPNNDFVPNQLYIGAEAISVFLDSTLMGLQAMSSSREQRIAKQELLAIGEMLEAAGVEVPFGGHYAEFLELAKERVARNLGVLLVKTIYDQAATSILPTSDMSFVDRDVTADSLKKEPRDLGTSPEMVVKFAKEYSQIIQAKLSDLFGANETGTEI